MYAALDTFLSAETWHTGSSYDLERFNRALAKIVCRDDFNADEMATYMYAVKSISKESDHPLAEAIEQRRSAAWAVREYLEANNLLND